MVDDCVKISDVKHKFPKDKFFGIKSPYMKFGSDGENLTLRNDNP